MIGLQDANMKTKELVLYAILISVLFVQEQLLAFLPNIQLTFFLIILYSKMLKLRGSLIIVIIHVFLDNIISGTLNPIIFIPMLVGYIQIPLIINIFFKNVKKPLILASYGVLASIIYSFCFIITNMIFLPINIMAYIIADIPFTIILCISSFTTVILLYNPISNLLSKLLIKHNIN